MSTSPDLGLPFVSQSQAQPEITHNEALLLIQALLKGAISAGDNAPPGGDTDGDVYVLGAAPTGAWAGQAKKIAVYYDGSWRFLPGVDSDGSNIAMGARHAGMLIFVQDVASLYYFDGADWGPYLGPPLGADDIPYTPVEEGAYASNVQQALDELYARTGG